MMVTRISKISFIALLLLTIAFIEPLNSAYRNLVSFEIYASTYVIEVKLHVKHIGDYGVISIHATYEGVYAYGFLIIKDPDNERPDIYAYAGLQNETFHISELNNDLFHARLTVSINDSGSLVVLDKKIVELRLRTPQISLNKVYISVFNATGREYDYPSVFINYVMIYACNSSIGLMYEALIDLKNPIPCYSEALVENQAINIVEYSEGNALKHYVYLTTGIAVTVAAVLIICRVFKRRVERSVKTSYHQREGASHPRVSYVFVPV